MGMMMGCAKKAEPMNQNLDTSKQVTLHILGSTEDNKAMEHVGQKFSELYPNCTVEYQYLQDYNETLIKRLSTEDGDVDLFITDNIQADSEYLPYALDLNAESDKLDLSDTYDGLVNNYLYYGTDELYSILLGA